MAILACCLVIPIPLSNIALIGVCTNILVEALNMPDDEWADKLINWSIVGICVGFMHTIFAPSFCRSLKNAPEESSKLRNGTIIICLVEIVAVSLVLTGLVVLGTDWPESYERKDLAKYTAISFIVVHSLTAFVMALSASLADVTPAATYQQNQTNVSTVESVQIEVVAVQKSNWVVQWF
ncbi:hypothetical protein HA402_008982 [Bradysia odoriphaga]|nr:hypothetical protein HA402_008982 [Bradysia odoriphaga]